MKKITRFEKSSQLLGKKLILCSAILAGSLFITGTVISCNAIVEKKDDIKTVEELDSVDDPTPIIIDQTEEIEIKNNEALASNNMAKARLIASNIIPIDFNQIDDKELKQEMIDDNISNYLNALQAVNENNPLQLVDMEDYTADNYDVLYDGKFHSDTVLAYNALAYQRFAENDIDINDALKELHTLMVLQTNPMEIDEETYNKLFSNLLRTLDYERHESLYDIYFPLAKAIHTITCDEKHYDDEFAIRCEDLDNEYQRLVK